MNNEIGIYFLSVGCYIRIVSPAPCVSKTNLGLVHAGTFQNLIERKVLFLHVMIWT